MTRMNMFGHYSREIWKHLPASLGNGWETRRWQEDFEVPILRVPIMRIPIYHQLMEDKDRYA